MKARAAAQEQTRLRITESAVELHEELGPARTSMSAIADRAGVRRSTLYRHFPDEFQLLEACSAHWAAENPMPNLEAWATNPDPRERLERALKELYGFYERNEQMLVNISRDAEVMPAVARQFDQFRDYFDAASQVLLAGWDEAAGHDALRRAAVGHALAFTTWRSLTREQGLERDEAVALMTRVILGAPATG